MKRSGWFHFLTHEEFWLKSESRVAILRDGAAILLLFVTAASHAVLLSSYFYEDAFITYRYARNLADGFGFVFNPGEKVLGTSTPLFTLILAFAGWIGLDISVTGTWLYCLSLAAVGVLGFWFLRRRGWDQAPSLFALAAAWAAGSALSFMGMETTFHLALILAVIVAADHDKAALTGILLGLLCLNRYDGMVVAFAVGMYLWFVRRRPPWLEAFIAVALFGSWLIFAGLYFGSIFPNTLGAKAGDSEPWSYIAHVLDSIRRSAFSPLREAGISLSSVWVQAAHVLVWTPVLLLVIRAPKHAPNGEPQPPARRCLWMPFGSAFILLIGYAVIGPPQGHLWYHLPGLYCFLLLVFAAWEWLFRQIRDRFVPASLRPASSTLATTAVASAVLLSLLFQPWIVQKRADWYLKNRNQDKIKAYSAFAQFIEEHRLQNTKILTREPGYLTYHTGQFSIDAAGLTTKGIYFHGPKERRDGFMNLIQTHQPDFISLSVREKSAERILNGFRPVVTASGHHWLLMAENAYQKHFDALYDHRIAPPMLPESPTRRDFATQERDINDNWTLRGRPLRSENGQGTVWSREFLIDFDELVFEISATSPQTRLELLVDNLVVMELDGRTVGAERVRRGWPVYPWKGRKARLRVVDHDNQGSIHVGLPAPKTYSSFVLEDGFEADAWSDFWQSPWSPTPQTSKPIGLRHGLGRIQSKSLASTLGLEGELQMSSRPFKVEHQRLLMLAYDVGSSRCGVHLWVDGERRLSWVGTGRKDGKIHMLKWDLTPFMGKEAVLQIRDGDPSPEVAVAVDSIAFANP